MLEHTAVRLIWDGGPAINVPEEMGAPHSEQLTGTVGEQLIELGTRICYDSLGTGRATKETLNHVLEAGHLSVLEHYAQTMFIHLGSTDIESLVRGLNLLIGLWNRPGIWCRPVEGGFRLTLNARTVREWANWTTALSVEAGTLAPLLDISGSLGRRIHELWIERLPLIIHSSEAAEDELVDSCVQGIEWVTPETPNEQWVSLFVKCSRGVSHELVRHGDFTAISQRSTRFVEEDESPWIQHPGMRHCKQPAMDVTAKAIEAARSAYRAIKTDVEPEIAASTNKRDARKQSRGAARGFLGNALETQIVFSASIAQWKRILIMRGSDHADAEIRQVSVQALEALRTSRYAAQFADLAVVPSLDGLTSAIEQATI
jgi:thymidylate synthase ThyX